MRVGIGRRLGRGAGADRLGREQCSEPVQGRAGRDRLGGGYGACAIGIGVGGLRGGGLRGGGVGEGLCGPAAGGLGCTCGVPCPGQCAGDRSGAAGGIQAGGGVGVLRGGGVELLLLAQQPGTAAQALLQRSRGVEGGRRLPPGRVGTLQGLFGGSGRGLGGRHGLLAEGDDGGGIRCGGGDEGLQAGGGRGGRPRLGDVVGPRGLVGGDAG